MKVKWTLLARRWPTVGGAMFLVAGIDTSSYHRVVTAARWDPGAVGPDLHRSRESGDFETSIHVLAWAPLPAFPSALEKLL